MIALSPWMIPAVLSRRRGVTWAQFFSGRVGAVWDPRLLSQMSTSRTGGTWGVSLSDTVGFVVDQARGGTAALGAELVTNGNFSNGATGWVAEAGWVASGGSAVATAAAAFNAVSQAAFPFVSNRSYLIEFPVTAASSGGVRINFAGGTQVSGATYTTAGTWREVLTAASGNNQLRIQAGAAGFTGSVDNISVRELPGCHMIASSDARRATLVGYNGGSTPALYANGAHGYGSASTLDLSGSDEVTVIMQVRKFSDATVQMLVESGTAYSSVNGAFAIDIPGLPGWEAVSKGTTAVFSGAYSGRPSTRSALLLLRARIGTPVATLFENGSQAANATASQGTGNYGNHLVNWMLRNSASPSLYATAEFGPLAIIGGALSADDLATAVALAAY